MFRRFTCLFPLGSGISIFKLLSKKSITAAKIKESSKEMRCSMTKIYAETNLTLKVLLKRFEESKEIKNIIIRDTTVKTV